MRGSPVKTVQYGIPARSAVGRFLRLSQLEQQCFVASDINFKRALTYTGITDTQTGLFAKKSEIRRSAS